MTTFEFTVKDEDGEVLFHAEKPTLEMLQEEVGRFERHLKDNLRPVEPGVYLR